MHRVSRFTDIAALAETTSARLISTVIDLQRRQTLAQLCLCGGATASALYRALGAQVGRSEVDPGRLELWWSDESYVPTEDPARNVGQALALLGGAFPLDPSRTHPMPPLTEKVDVDEAALQYATELGQTRFDICLLSVGRSGHVASVPVGTSVTHASSVMGVHNWPKGPPERMSITLEQINRSSEVWILAAGAHKAEAVAAALNGDETLPAARARGIRATRWFITEDAARLLPRFQCDW